MKAPKVNRIKKLNELSETLEKYHLDEVSNIIYA